MLITARVSPSFLFTAMQYYALLFFVSLFFVNSTGEIVSTVLQQVAANALQNFVFSPEAKLMLHKTVEESSICWASDNSISEYDFVVDIDSVTSFGEEGWSVDALSKDAHDVLFSGEKYDAENAQVLGLLGYYSKGKSFLLNGIYNAGLQYNDDKKWFDFSAHPKYKRNVKVGAGVTTKGISGVFTGFNPQDEKQTMRNARILLLDTAGRNAPATRSVYTDKVEKLRESISAVRSKERLIDDIILSVADSIIYVVDEVLNEDQRTIMFILEHIGKSSKLQVLFSNSCSICAYLFHAHRSFSLSLRLACVLIHTVSPCFIDVDINVR